jgi:SAM-dependent methyltransferase
MSQTPSQPPAFDPQKYKDTTRDQWQAAAGAWHRWGATLTEWLGGPTAVLFDMAAMGTGQQVLDVAAGAGEQTLLAARRVGPKGRVLATDISSNILEFAQQSARSAGLANVETRVMDGENLDLPESAFDVVVSRVGLIYFPDQQKALRGMLRILKPGGKIAAIVYSTPDRNGFFSVPVSVIRRRANLPPPAAGQPGPFSLGADGVLKAAYENAGFRDVKTKTLSAPLRMASASECVRFEKESFGALHQMLAALSESEREAVWKEIEQELKKFEAPGGFTGPCELVLGVGTK